MSHQPTCDLHSSYSVVTQGVCFLLLSEKHAILRWSLIHDCCFVKLAMLLERWILETGNFLTFNIPFRCLQFRPISIY